jgi:predicted transposase/invertase (TIGR01784 family)
LELIGQPQAAENYEFKSIDIKQTAFRIDRVFLPPRKPEDQPVYFVEIQFQKDAELYHRFFAEIFLYLRHYPSTPEWYGLLILPSRNLLPDRTRLFDSLLSSPNVRHIYLNELPNGEEPLSLAVIKLIIAPEASTPDIARRLIHRTRQLEERNIPNQQLLELIETIVVYKFPLLNRQELEAMLGLGSLKQTRVYQEAVEEGVQQGLQQGLQKIVQRQLQQRFGTIAPQTQTQIAQLSIA